MTVPRCGVTAKATSLDTIEVLATETVMVPAFATSCAGTFTASMVQEPAAGQFPGVAEFGIRTALPNFTCVLMLRPVPVIVSVKLPLPAGTLVGEIAAMLGCTACGGGGETLGFPPPQPEKNTAEVSTAGRNAKCLPMEHRRAPASCQMCLGLETIEATPLQLKALKAEDICERLTPLI